MEFLKKNKKGVLLIVSGLLAIVGGYIGWNEDAEQQIVNVLDMLF
jgi:hypothetical protein